MTQESNNNSIVHLLIDSTGSMATSQEQTISAFNEYIESLKTDPSTQDFRFSVSCFDSDRGFRPIVEDCPMTEVPLLTLENYKPHGLTPLYDAFGKAMLQAQGLRENSKAPVLIVLMTDGQENHSSEYTKEGIQALVKQHGDDGWNFVYLGCELDAMHEGQMLGIDASNTLRYTADSASNKRMASRMSASTVAYASGGAQGMSAGGSNFFQGENDVSAPSPEKPKPSPRQKPKPTII
jgi:uncharacterized protein YegL